MRKNFHTVSTIREISSRGPVSVRSPEDVAEIIWPLIRQDQEQAYVIALNSANLVVTIEPISLGSVAASIIHPVNVIRPLLFSAGVAGGIVVHNHPGGSMEASRDDLATCRRLQLALSLVGFELLDFVILGQSDFNPDRAKVLSLKTAGLMMDAHQIKSELNLKGLLI